MNILHDPRLHRPDVLAWPRTRFGVIAAWLGLVCLGLVLANIVTPSDGSQSGLLQAEVILMILTAPAALITAVIAAFRDHDHSLFVWIPIVVGVAFLVFVLVELTFPHAAASGAFIWKGGLP